MCVEQPLDIGKIPLNKYKNAKKNTKTWQVYIMTPPPFIHKSGYFVILFLNLSLKHLHFQINNNS